MMNKCEIVRDILPLYVDNVCSTESKAMLEEHIAECAECKKIYEQLQSSVKLPMDDGADVKGFKRFIKKKIWLKTIIAIAIFLVVWYVAKVAIALNVSEIWPNGGADFYAGLEVVDMDGELYLYHGGDFLGMGSVYDISDIEDMNAGVYKFYLGQPGYIPRFKHGFLLAWSCRDIYERLNITNREGEYYAYNSSQINKIVYCHKNGEEVLVIWERD